MKSTVVGSFPVEIKEASSAKSRLLSALGAYDPFKDSIKDAVTAQLDAGVDIISDGQVRGDMVSIFTEFIPGMKIVDGNTEIVSKIRKPIQEISVKDLQYAKKISALEQFIRKKIKVPQQHVIVASKKLPAIM